MAFVLPIFEGYPYLPAIKHGNGKSPANGGLRINRSKGMFHGHV
jgi:hypothetical protein